MAISYSYDLQAKLTTESIKTDMLNIFMDLFAQNGRVLDKEAKDFVVERTEELLEEYNMNSSMEVEHYSVADDSKDKKTKELFISRATFDEVLGIFRHNVAKMMINLMSYELATYYREREDKD